MSNGDSPIAGPLRAFGPVATTIFLDTAGIVPLGLLGALSVQISNDLRFPTVGIGVLVAAFFVGGGLAAGAFGRFIDVVGAGRAVHASTAITAGSLLTIPLFTSPWWVMAVPMGVAGASFSITMPATNALLGRSVAPRWMATAIGMKQAAVPLSLIVGSLFMPFVGESFGWRPAFYVAAAMPLMGLGLLRVARPAKFAVPDRPPSLDLPLSQRAALLMGLSFFFASMMTGALASFSVATLASRGLTHGAAAATLALSNLLGVAVRLLSGVIVDRTHTQGYVPIALMMSVGGLGVSLLGTSDPRLMVVGCLLGFGFGWGWPGIGHYLAVRTAGASPGAASAKVQSGGMLGSAFGPMLMATVLPILGYRGAWPLMTTLACLGGLAMFLARPRPAAVLAGDPNVHNQDGAA